MAHIENKALFFTTSPRSPIKMIPEIRLLCERFQGQKWSGNSGVQAQFAQALSESDFFEGNTSKGYSEFSARDRITRAPKALGFVDLSPRIALTESGTEFIYGKRPQEVYLRQLLKFQLPSPYHKESKNITGTFFVRPYLEIIRLIRELDYITFDKLKIFALQLTDYRKFNDIKASITAFRAEKEARKGEYKRFVHEVWTETVLRIHKDRILSGNVKTRESEEATISKFIATQQGNMRDYADACFRYLRYTGLISIAHRSRTITLFPDRLHEVDFILSTVERKPVFVNDETAYKEHLFSSTLPELYVDIKQNVVDAIMRISAYTRQELFSKDIDELKDLRDAIIQEHKNAIVVAQVEEIKSYSLYSEIMETYKEIISDGIYDAPLMLEYNTWRAMTMLNGGDVQGNFKLDDAGQPLSTAIGNMSDIECNYGDFVLSVEVTLQGGQRQYEAEGEPVARHYGQMKKRTGKEAYCLFIAPTINPAALMHFYALNKIENRYYGGKTQIIPLGLNQFIRLMETAYNHPHRPEPHDIKRFLSSAMDQICYSADETEWSEHINSCINQWLVA